MKKNKILIIEINQENFDALNNVLKKDDFIGEAVIANEELKKVNFGDGGYSLILVNADVDYVDIEEIVAFANTKYGTKVPIIYIDSAKVHDKKLLSKCFENGGSDYIKNPFDSKELLARINYHFHLFEKIRKCQEGLDQLANFAMVDQLSKLSSKVHIQSILKHQLNNYKRYKTPTSIIYFSVLNIDKIIGKFGLKVGEKLIYKFSQDLKNFIRKSDEVGRWDGADYVVVLTNTNLKAAEILAKKLKIQLGKADMLKGITPDLAFGLTTFRHEDDVQDVMNRVENALHEAVQQEYGKMKVN
ncbi:diguanylate cyclase [Sulfurimonas sp.]|uniref:diguanylate cyclase domain-containing protein n=1 Tax=Sulfurimonas sp. TaxID=2022749 RepID=UPI00260560C8|nr:diguanylate cyclase [Sulfurimonas sp.]